MKRRSLWARHCWILTMASGLKYYLLMKIVLLLVWQQLVWYGRTIEFSNLSINKSRSHSYLCEGIMDSHHHQYLKVIDDRIVFQVENDIRWSSSETWLSWRTEMKKEDVTTQYKLIAVVICVWFHEEKMHVLDGWIQCQAYSVGDHELWSPYSAVILQLISLCKWKVVVWKCTVYKAF